MSGDQVLGEGAIVGENVDDLGVSKLVAGHDILAIHLGANHVVAHICVHMIRKIQHRSTLQSHISLADLTSTVRQGCLV